MNGPLRLNTALDLMDALLAPIVLNEAREVVWAGEVESSAYGEAIDLLISGVKAGHIEYAGTLAEAFAIVGPLRDPARAYVYYYLSYAREGAVVKFQNQSPDPSTYQGPAGDFRNEGMVSGLVHELGVHLLPSLDRLAADLLANEI